MTEYRPDPAQRRRRTLRLAGRIGLLAVGTAVTAGLRGGIEAVLPVLLAGAATSAALLAVYDLTAQRAVVRVENGTLRERTWWGWRATHALADVRVALLIAGLRSPRGVAPS